MDYLTRQWIRNRSDELAAEDGCWFDAERGAWAVWWIERYCKLYEGEWAGENVLLRSGCDEVDHQILLDWDAGGKEASIDRAIAYARWVAKGNRGDWQYECFMRLFGWTKNSARWGRPVRRFTAASIWIPKKQKKSPSLAAMGVYLICGDGEMGSKCFGGAKDGNQAGIAMAHAIAMVEQSPELYAECKINKNEKSIEHVPSRSKYKPLSSANERSKTSKEGLNGHILIDETHVVDEDFISIISRAGISRAEPIHAEVSTAGNNPDGYGKRRQDYARLVMDGTEKNNSLFVAIYEAPQDLSDSDLDKDPIKFGIMANPAWGHTAHEEEYLADYNQSKRTLSGLSDFKMYRLNIWQHSSNPWVRMDDWDRSAGDLSDWSTADAVGGGVDLGGRDDLASFALCARFSIGEDSEQRPLYRYEMRSWSYIAEDATRDVTKYPFSVWVDRGLLLVKKFPTKALRDELVEMARKYHVDDIAFDPHNAQQLGEDLTAEGFRAARAPQTSSWFNEPIKDCVNAIAEGRFRHDGNQLLRWAANNAVVEKNDRLEWRFNKARSKEKIDPIVAAVMAFRVASLAAPKATGSLFIC